MFCSMGFIYKALIFDVYCFDSAGTSGAHLKRRTFGDQPSFESRVGLKINYYHLSVLKEKTSKWKDRWMTGNKWFIIDLSGVLLFRFGGQWIK